MEQINFYEFLADLELEEIFRAYVDCRKNKRRTISSLRFEYDYERCLIELWQDIITKRYQIRPSSTFIVTYPVRREVFAASFRDRIVHHLVINRLMDIFESLFIRHSYSCRVGKGTLDGVYSIADMLKRCSDNYQTDAYILRLDIQGFFFHIDKKILHKKLKKLVDTYYFSSNKSTIVYLLEQILQNNPIHNCHMRSDKSQWDLLPKSKSLFFSHKNCGLPIGNLTSQIFANFYLNDLDHYIGELDKELFYGRYVDDLVLIHKDRDFLIQAKEHIQTYLKKELHLSLHPKKISLTHYGQGCAFVGAYIKPGRIYPSKRFQGAFLRRIDELNKKWRLVKGNYTEELVMHTLSSINSYLGLLKHYNAFRFKVRAWNRLCPEIRKVFYADIPLHKITIRQSVKQRFWAEKRKKLPSAFL